MERRVDDIKAILYDLDGVLVDACDIHYRSLNRALLEISGTFIPPDEHEKTFNGLPSKQKLDILKTRGLVKEEEINDIYRLKQEYTNKEFELLTTDTEKIKLHKNVRKLDVKIGCVTNAIRPSAETMLRNTGQLEFIDVLVSSSDVEHPKPSSEGYISAMVKLGVYPREVLIVEDSPKGLTAAIATGASVLPVKNATEVTWDTIQEFL